MARSLTASDRAGLIRLASSLPKRSPERRAILAGLKKLADMEVTQKDIDQAGRLSGVDPAMAKYLVDSGLEDGDVADDRVKVSKASFPAGKLKPSQTSMVLDKSLGMAIAMLNGKMGLGGDLGAIISADGYIMDGHHRWSASILAGGPGTSVGGYKADLPGKELVKVLNIVTKGEFEVMQGNAGKGGIAAYTPANIEKALREGLSEGFGQSTAADVKSALEKLGKGDVEAGIRQMANNVKKMVTAVPGWAPDRKDMPVIEPEQVPAAAKLLSQGVVNWKIPFAKKEAGFRFRR